MKTKKLLVSSLIQCHFDYTCSAWYSGLSKKMKCRMQRSQNKIVRFFLNVPPRFHVGANEFNINLMAPAYLRTNVEMVHHRYPTRASNLACVIPKVKGSGQTSFFIPAYATGTNCLLKLSNVKLKSVLEKR